MIRDYEDLIEQREDADRKIQLYLLQEINNVVEKIEIENIDCDTVISILMKRVYPKNSINLLRLLEMLITQLTVKKIDNKIVRQLKLEYIHRLMFHQKELFTKIPVDKTGKAIGILEKLNLPRCEELVNLIEDELQKLPEILSDTTGQLFEELLEFLEEEIKKNKQ